MTERKAEHVGARLVHLPTVRNKYLDTLAHSAVCTVHMAIKERPDVALYFIGGNALVVPFARMAGIPSVLQIDGLDSERAKWPAPARAYLRFTERISPAAATIAVTDSEAVADSLEARYGRRITTIPYGARLDDPGDSGRCADLGIEPGRFVLFVGRLVPENNAICWSRRTAARHRLAPGDRRRRPVFGRLHRRSARRGRTERDLHRVPVRRRLRRAGAPGWGDVRAHRGRRHAPGDHRGDGGGSPVS